MMPRDFYVGLAYMPKSFAIIRYNHPKMFIVVDFLDGLVPKGKLFKSPHNLVFLIEYHCREAL